ncbi:conserved hypothetical protein [Rhodoferax ferrireducens T118]|uniref:Lipoprotein n=1 Tax=Albidiferax ferrireducens (strain ATCC BAA-621 / DSM 15236 / T118) TaxID=338969 RepID=Q21UR4_ALBFT|nr:hypothetical protein [Rhodoferax ferrireducens]ABD70489.1 conserved hypothetical protein [Rhodoferax ferrireducens T118]WPC65627.1 hypothetical protein SBP18_14155 [Rhodoferax ferrireducens]
MNVRLLITTVTLLLAGCVIPGMEPDPRIAQREAEAKAIGGACRYGLRGIEDCYSLNEEASKAAIFDGWKDMDQYMRENKIEGIRAAVAKVEPVEVILDNKSAKTDIADKEAPPKLTHKPAAAATAAIAAAH